MKKILFIILALCLGLASFAAMPIIDPELRAELERRGDDEKIKVNIILAEQSDMAALSRDASWLSTKQARRMYVVETLKRQAEASQEALTTLLNEMEHNGLVSEIRPLWIVNSISCYATKSAILGLDGRPDIMTIYHSEESQWIFDTASAPVGKGDGREITENLLQVNAPQVWEQGYTGQGVVIAVIDTGARLDHTDLEGRLWDGGTEYPNHGYDFYYNDDDPSDDLGHGTHVIGTICGNGASGSQTGIAPGSSVMVLKAFDSSGIAEETHWITAMQFAVEHGCDAFSMSLGMVNAEITDKEILRRSCEAILDAGIIGMVCAGNEGHIQFYSPIPNNVRVPASCPPPYLDPDQTANPGDLSCVMAIGAVDYDDAAANFTSQGPVTWQNTEFGDYAYNPGIGLIRPDVCAPGVSIKSLKYDTNDGYSELSGTSQATPCVAGIVALMLQKNPELLPADICRILEGTSVKLTPNKSNVTGVGRVDALAAVNAVSTWDDVNESTLNANVFPNPTHDNVTIQCEGMSLVEIYAMDGRLVKSLSIHSSECLIDGLESGVYLLRIGTNKGTLTKKIVKM